MTGVGRILVPVDGSKGADKALEMAIVIANACQSEIHLLYVSYFDGDTDSKVEKISWLPDQAVGSVTQVSKSIIDNARRKIPEGTQCIAHIRTGIPSREIVAFSKEQGMNLIVMGGRGLGLVEGFLLGSVSQSVLEEAKSSVMVVR